MATTKVAPKKVAKKVAIKKAVPKRVAEIFKELPKSLDTARLLTDLNGRKFKAVLGGKRGTVNGVIYSNGKNAWLCTNHMYLDGDRSDNRFGFNYSWLVSSFNDFSRIETFYLSNKNITKKTISKIPNPFRAGLFGYPLSKTREGIYAFGCGAVSVSKEQLETFAKISKLVDKKDLMDFQKMMYSSYDRGVYMNEENVKRVNSILEYDKK